MEEGVMTWDGTMPVLRPVRIHTKDQPWYKRIWTWFSEVRQWELMEDYYFWYKGVLLCVKKGFFFDGASIPRIFWTVLSPTGLLLIPSLFHDHGYRFDYLWQVLEGGEIVKWQEGAGKMFWDGVFLDISDMVNGKHVASYVAYGAVAAGGWFAWWSGRSQAGSAMQAGL